MTAKNNIQRATPVTITLTFDAEIVGPGNHIQMAQRMAKSMKQTLAPAMAMSPNTRLIKHKAVRRGN